MRELFEINQPENPMEAARRGARPILRRRFYESAAVVETPQGYALQLDGKPVHTPARRVLCAPNAAIAQNNRRGVECANGCDRPGKNAADPLGERDH